jgi:aspartate kinase
MPLIIQKYGGKSLATPEDITQVARLILQRVESGVQVVVVVSAMGDTTDRYVDLARAVNPAPAGRELDVLLSVGERISIAMLALALNGLRKDIAVSLTGAQAGIITDTVHTAARIVEIRPMRVREILDQRRIPIIAGYQGITTDKNISTLGRGGTDATAVGLAVALGADRVEFMKDVDGIHSADPKQIPSAKIIDKLSFEEALEMMGCGAKILQAPAVEMAAEHGIPLAVGNSRTGVAGTIVTDKPLVRQTLTSVHTTERVDYLNDLLPENFFRLLDRIRDCGLSPLMSFRYENSCAIILRPGEAEFLRSDNRVVDRSLDLVTLIGPGVTSNNELARAIQILCKEFEPSIVAMTASSTRISLLMKNQQAKLLAGKAHELCLKSSQGGAASPPH